MTKRIPLLRPMALMIGVAGLSACADNHDWDMRSGQDGFSTSAAVQSAMAKRPQPDDRGIISYPGYQVVVARDGDTVATVADRIGMSAGELARYNGVTPNAALHAGEVLALPSKVSEPTEATGATIGGSGAINISTLANNANSAIDRAQGQQGNTAPAAANAPVIQPGTQPIRHKVQPGESAYSIARLYNVPVKSLADWNGLDANLDVRVGQVLLIPPTAKSAGSPARTAAAGSAAATASAVTPPGRQSPVAPPPSSSRPLPKPAAPTPAAKTPASPDLAKDRTASSAAQFAMPVQGKIIRGFVPDKKDGKAQHNWIDIAAPAGSPVRAAGGGTVAVVTHDTKNVNIIVIRHSATLQTFYSNVTDIKVKKGEAVKRGQVIAAIKAGNPAFMGFGVAKGFQSVDPMPYLQ